MDYTVAKVPGGGHVLLMNGAELYRGSWPECMQRAMDMAAPDDRINPTPGWSGTVEQYRQLRTREYAGVLQ